MKISRTRGSPSKEVENSSGNTSVGWTENQGSFARSSSGVFASGMQCATFTIYSDPIEQGDTAHVSQRKAVDRRSMVRQRLGRHAAGAEPGDRRDDRHGGACRSRRFGPRAGGGAEGFPDLVQGGRLRSLQDNA